MWMVGYNDEDGEYNMAHESFHSWKHLPLVPRPVTSNNATTSAANSSSNIFHGDDLFPQCHNLAVTEQSKFRELNSQPVVMSSSRWNPTPEQLRALEELYHRGTRTPSAEQIQNITAQLRRFGKIEGKNVFYWFQNHKARERQKRRRQMESSANQVAGYRNNTDYITQKKESGGRNRPVFEGDQTRNNRDSFSMQRIAKETVAEYRPDEWIQFDEAELKQRRNFAEKNGMWQMMQLSCPIPHPPAAAPATPIINTPAATPCPTHTITSITGATRAMDPKLNKAQHDLSFSKAPYRANIGVIHLDSINDMVDQDNCVESQTLQLFPLGGDDDSEEIYDKGSELSLSAAMNANFSIPSQFFEFLPLKN